MAFGLRTFYGYKVNNNFSDVIDTDLALRRLTLNIGDLDIIRGAAEAGVIRQDVIALSGLDKNLYKELDRYLGETDTYAEVMESSAGVDSSLQGNLQVNGALAASSIRYKFLDTDTNQIGLADISTSRVSAWSTTSSTPNPEDPIFYGSQVKIKTGGTVSVDKLTWGEVAQPKIFNAELPTHKITTEINGEVVKLYAMKSIPLKFDGFFRNFNASVSVNPVNGINVGWRVINQINAADETRIETETLQYRSVRGAPRRVEIYYPPDRFTSISLTGIGLSKLPQAELPSLTTLNIAFNEFREMPSLVNFSPSLQGLTLHRNNLYLAENANLRTLNLAVVNRVPTSITSLNMYGCYFGSVRCVDRSDQDGSGTIVGAEITSGIGGSDSMSVIEARFPSLVTLNVGRGSGARFGPDEYNALSHLPSVSNTCESYFARENDFRAVPAVGIKNLTNLRNFDVYGNRSLQDSSFTLDSFQLGSVNIGNTLLPIPDLSSRTLLTTFVTRRNRSTSSLFSGSSDQSYKFSNCTSLQTLDLYRSRASGFIPKFIGNQNLRTVDMYAAQNITGGRPSGTDFVLYKDTFENAREIRFFRVLSNSLLVGKGFEQDTFKNLNNLDYLYWYSYGRSGSGGGIELPDVSSCPALRYMIMHVNNFEGSVPSFAPNDRIYYVQLSRNNLTGTVPTFTNKLRMRYLFLNNNQLSSFSGFDNTPAMDFVYLYNNNIAGLIPMLSTGSPNIRRLYLHNNQFDGYVSGSFAGLTRLQRLDISNNQLSASDLNSVIDDLFANYESAPRSGVAVNLRGQSRAVGYNPSSQGSPREQDIRSKLDFLSSNGWTITIGG